MLFVIVWLPFHPLPSWAWAVAAAVALSGLGLRYGVVIDESGVVLTKTWLGIPHGRSRFGLDVEVRHYDSDYEPYAVVLVEPGGQEDARSVFGSPKTAGALHGSIVRAIGHHRGS